MLMNVIEKKYNNKAMVLTTAISPTNIIIIISINMWILLDSVCMVANKIGNFFPP